MPVHPSEEEAPSGIYEKIAKDPSSTTESTASDHETHDNEHNPHQSGKASAQDFQSKGPQIPMSMSGEFAIVPLGKSMGAHVRILADDVGYRYAAD